MHLYEILRNLPNQLATLSRKTGLNFLIFGIFDYFMPFLVQNSLRNFLNLWSKYQSFLKFFEDFGGDVVLLTYKPLSYKRKRLHGTVVSASTRFMS